MKRPTLLLLFNLLVYAATAQTNILFLHQLVEESKKEHSLQLETRNAQAETDANEEINRRLMGSVKLGYQNIKERFTKINFLIEAAGIGHTALPIIQSIIANQKVIIEECQESSEFIPFAFATEKKFVKRSQSLLAYLVGLSAVLGDLNQMANSDRRLLFQHVIDELKEINRISIGVAGSLTANRQQHSNIGLFREMTQDVSAMEEVIRNAKSLEH